MELLKYVLMGFAPGVFWLWFFRRKDDLEPEPRWMLVRVFLLGCLATVPVLWLRPFLEPVIPPGAGWRAWIVDSFFVTALPEEVWKLLAFLLGAGFHRELDEPLDGILYGIAAGLGFASVENVLYLVSTGDPVVLGMRAFTATLGHVVFTGSMGFLLGLARFRHGWRQAALLLSALPLAVALHGLYDLFLMSADDRIGLISLLICLPLGLILLGVNLRWSRARSPDYHPELTDRDRR